MNLGLKGRNCVVSAGSRGIGFASAMLLAEEGANVALCGRSEANAQDAAARIREATGRTALGYAADLGSVEDINRFVSRAAAELGSIDVLIGNAGHPPGPMRPALDFQDEEWRTGFEEIFLSVVRLTRAVLPHMGSGWGRMVFPTTMSAKQPEPMHAASAALRAATNAWAKCLADEVADRGILVNTILTGIIDTERMAEVVHLTMDKAGVSRDAAVQQWIGDVPLKRFAQPFEIAKVIALLASDSSYITGQSVAVDGGRMRTVY
ncbi:SDR family oxidoreductase [Pseudorhodoferax soli]|uniref:3-oxoacyl-[acyl-carrier protein] reductase n=1 Tax=Pseudorhodoferax soli TaxID=545864 RepID=A0A368XKV3_9BURK|nr:SDR family oxidoreductase [Pseudorhodoferax soli]RCW68602.1 3-oxoacyl-[acyl-carrier protein] reductase [Pseudorhodoferax soli]